MKRFTTKQLAYLNIQIHEVKAQLKKKYLKELGKNKNFDLAYSKRLIFLIGNFDKKVIKTNISYSDFIDDYLCLNYR